MRSSRCAVQAVRNLVKHEVPFRRQWIAPFPAVTDGGMVLQYSCAEHPPDGAGIANGSRDTPVVLQEPKYLCGARSKIN